jgi:ADP-ribose pyrophosphatase YjhB (NUDIX family)
VRVSAFIPRQGCVLLVSQRRSAERTERPYWLLPGGGVGHGESLHDALTRELLEELGVTIHPTKPIALVESISPDAAYPKHVLHIIIAAAWPLDAERRIDSGGEVAVCDTALLQARFVPSVELDDLALRPPLAGFLRQRLACADSPGDTHAEGTSDDVRYLGRLW